MKYSPFRHADSVFWKSHPIHLTFFVTRRCNARCKFCFYLSGGKAPGESTDELSLTEIDAVAASLGRLLWLAFSGGEIFLRSDIVDVARIFYERTRPAIMLFPTNGMMPEVICERMEAVLKACPKSTVVTKLSLEGPETVHDAMRGIPGSFRKTMDTYENLGTLLDRYENFELGINTLFCRENQDYMDETITFVSGLDRVKTHTVSLIRGDVSDPGLKDVDANTYKRTIEKLADNLRRKTASTYRFRGARLKAAQDIVQRRLISQTLSNQRQIIPCYAGKLNLVLTESGDVFPCESFRWKMGNMRDHHLDMKRLLRTVRSKETLNKVRKRGCFCTHECYMMTNILFNPRLYPELIREYVKL